MTVFTCSKALKIFSAVKLVYSQF